MIITLRVTFIVSLVVKAKIVVKAEIVVKAKIVVKAEIVVKALMIWMELKNTSICGFYVKIVMN